MLEYEEPKKLLSEGEIVSNLVETEDDGKIAVYKCHCFSHPGIIDFNQTYPPIFEDMRDCYIPIPKEG